MAKHLSAFDGREKTEVISLDPVSTNYSTTSGAQFINSTVTGNTFIWKSHPGKPQTVSTWFSDIRYWLHHKDTRKDLLQNTGNWLLQKDVFREWNNSSQSSVLWLHGIPGSGKTKLVAQVIDSLEPSLPEGSVAYFYCLRSVAEDERSRPEEVIRSILRQLAFTGTETKVLKRPAAEIYESKEKEAKIHCSDEVERLNWLECVRLLVEILDGASTVIVIDAFDELKKETRWMLYEAFDTILEDVDTGIVRIFISSRDDGDIMMKLSRYPNVYIKATDNKEDIQQFVLQEVDKAIKHCRLLRGNVSKELKGDILSTLIKGAQGMFRWVSLQIQALCSPQMKTTSAVKKALGKLPKTLEESYDVVYSQMLDTDTETLRKSQIIVQWLLCAKRQLRTSEFIGAVCANSWRVENTSPVEADAEPLTVEEVLDICCNLVVWDQSLDTFRIAHLSVREYFEKKIHFGKHEIHAQALEACIDILIGETNPGNTAAFKLYATTYWPNHSSDLGLQGPSGLLRSKMMTFLFQSNRASEFYFDWLHSLNASSLKRLGSGLDIELELDQSNKLHEADSSLSRAGDIAVGQSSILFLASAFNLPWILNELSTLESFLPSTISTKRGNGDNALIVAAVWGNREIAQKLLDHGVDVDTTGYNGWTPLHRVAQNGHQMLAKCLLESGANANALSDDGRHFTPIHEAIWHNNLAMVDLLLGHGADIEARDNDGLTPLLLAVKEGKEEIVPILLKWNADVSATDKNGDTAFFHAAERHEPIFVLFIQLESIPESLFDGSVLCSAVRSCSRKSVQTLFERGIDVNAPDKLGKHPLDYALEQGSSQVISFLVSHRARPALKWNTSSYHIEQWKSETWFSELVKSLATVNSTNPAPYIRSSIPTKVFRDDFIEVSEDSPRVPYLWVRIPDGFTFVSRIVFTTESHDQGFSSDAAQSRGTYDNSWTWFEAAIHPSQSYKFSSSLRYPPPRQHVQTNVHAISEFRVHTNVWDYQDEEYVKQDWLKFLKPGDIVQLIPRARYRAWVNYVKRAEIEIFDGAPTSLALRPGSSPAAYATIVIRVA